MKPDARPPLSTGQHSCHDREGAPVPCPGSGQDGAFKAGQPWPEPRFAVTEEQVEDRLTGLIWPQNANPGDFPLNWQEALAYVSELNASHYLGHNDWRLPNRRELRSLISHQTRRPALPDPHPFIEVFANWYWSSTSAAQHPDHAWYVNLDGGRMFYGGKDQAYMVWPVRGQGNGLLPRTGQRQCYDSQGRLIDCADSGQDGEHLNGRDWPTPRFETQADGTILDRLTGLLWWPSADLAEAPVSWEDALASIAALNQASDRPRWRLPNINELESLVDCSRYGPALPSRHPFSELRDIYWSASTSLYEPDWAWALYLDKGAVGVGQKSFARFHVWAVADVE
jgi:hypothetical protein